MKAMDTNVPKVTVLTAGGASKRSPAKKNTASPKSPTTTTTAAGPSKNASHPSQDQQETQNNPQGSGARLAAGALEFEEPSERVEDRAAPFDEGVTAPYSDNPRPYSDNLHSSSQGEGGSIDPLKPPREEDPYSSARNEEHRATSSENQTKQQQQQQQQHNHQELIWLFICFLGIMASFVCYGLLLEFATSGGRTLHELSFLFVTSGLYTLTAAAGRYVRDETPTTIPPARFAVLGLTSMGSTFFSVRSLRYVIYPIQVLAKSCKPVPVMLMGAMMGKSYPLKKYINVVMIVLGVALFMGGGSSHKTSSDDDGEADAEVVEEEEDVSSSPSQIIGIVLLFVSLCFDGGTGAYEDKLMSVHSVQPFDLMYNIQLGKTILAGIGLLVMNELHLFIKLVHEMGFLLLALGLSGALGQVFIFVTIAKFGALTCSIIGLARKVTTLCASIYFYGHHLNAIQGTGLLISVTAMVLNFWGKKKGGGHGHGDGGRAPTAPIAPEEMEKMLSESEDEEQGDLEMMDQEDDKK